jgi:hypothetical protein
MIALPSVLKLLPKFVLLVVEQLADDSIVQADDLIGDGPHAFDRQRDQRRVPSLPLELHQFAGGHLTSLACGLQKPVLVNPKVYPGRQN